MSCLHQTTVHLVHSGDTPSVDGPGSTLTGKAKRTNYLPQCQGKGMSKMNVYRMLVEPEQLIPRIESMVVTLDFSTSWRATQMHTYEVRMSPKPGSGGSNITIVVQAHSDTEARRIAEGQQCNHRVEAVHRKS